MIKKFVLGTAFAAAGLALVGAGAGATFTDATHSVQKVSAGTLNVTVSADADGAITSWDGKSVELPAAADLPSTFKTDAIPVVITNSGTVTANEVWLGMSVAPTTSAADAALLDQLNVCIFSPYIDEQNWGGVVWNGKLTDLVASGQQVTGPVKPGDTDQYTTEFYAGNVTTKCGDHTTASLTNDAQGGSVTPTVTVTYHG